MSLTSPERTFGPYNFAVTQEESETNTTVTFTTQADNVVLHWGVGISKTKEWKNPLSIEGLLVPAATLNFDPKAAQSTFAPSGTSNTLQIIIEKSSPVLQINFVFKKDNQWFNNNSKDYFINIRPPVLPEILKSLPLDLNNLLFEIIEAEMNGGEWTLMHRFKLCNGWIDRLNKNLQGLAWIFVWMRYSALRKLTWQRNYNTKPVELAWSQKNVTYAITNALKDGGVEGGMVGVPMMLKGVLMTMGKSGENGQRIRDEILHIMSRGKIRHYKPEIDKHNYYEQWHQKLHNNTTYDDIGICEAIIAYNETQSMSKYWEVLQSHGITKERLTSFDRPITVEPYLAPQIVPDLYNYLALLKSVHGSVDLQQSINICKSFISSAPLCLKLSEISSNLQHWDKIGQMERVLICRKEMKNFLVANKNSDQFRELVYLDIGLEGYTRQICEEIIHLDIELQYLCRELGILIENVLIYCSTEELEATFFDFQQFSKNLNGYESALLLKSNCDRLQRILGSFVDQYSQLVDPKAKFLGGEFKIDKETQDLFVEEAIRGSLYFAISIVLKKLDKALRSICGDKSVLIISPKPVQGQIMLIESLSSVIFHKFESFTILICEKVSGEEDIPENVVGVIAKTELDTLAHISVRARNSKIFLASVFDSELLSKFEEYLGKFVQVRIVSGKIELKEIDDLKETGNGVEATVIKEPLAFSGLAVGFEEFVEGRTGAKGNNCAELNRCLPAQFRVPNSAAIPYGSFEYLLEKEYNSGVYDEIRRIIGTGLNNNQETVEKLEMIRKVILSLQVTEPDLSILKGVSGSVGCNEADWEKAWTAIKKVWASKYNLRVFLNTQKSKIPLDSVKMSVLCQEVINGEYAFVLHTKNPMNDNQEEIYGELVQGLGETLVSAADGRALAFIANKVNGKIKIESFCNKSEVLRGGGVIFRSDSNSEDLIGFAGAGLFDSFIMQEPKSSVPRYASDEIVKNLAYREFILKLLKDVGQVVEDVFCGVPQDIEGVIKDGQIFVVQSRPQV